MGVGGWGSWPCSLYSGSEPSSRSPNPAPHPFISSPTQLQELLETSNKVQRLCPGPRAQAVQQGQQAVTQAREVLRLCVEQRRAQLERACILAHFHTAVRAPSLAGVCVCMRSCEAPQGESSRATES